MKVKENTTLLALGAESAGNFSVYHKSKLYLSEDFGDLLKEKNFERFKIAVIKFLRTKKIKPAVIATDLHPLYKTTLLGEKLISKFKAKHIKVQHHIAHIFSAIGDKIFNSEEKIENWKLKIGNSFYGIACDGAGYGFDGKIWGGEIFKIQFSIFNFQFSKNSKILNSKTKITRIGSLEEQVMIGGDLAVKEPVRMLISILSKFLPKEKVYQCVKRYYSKNQFEVLFSQLRQNFNCQETSSTGRVLDAVSVLLGFCGNKRNYKHEPVDLLEKNSTTPYFLKPKINPPKSPFCKGGQRRILLTTPLFEYLVKNINKDRKKLAATAQFYIAQGLYGMILKSQKSKVKSQEIYFAGGMANNKIISSYLGNKGVYLSKKIPRGDAGISFGQIVYYLLNY